MADAAPAIITSSAAQPLKRLCSDIGEPIELAGAVADGFDRHPHGLENGEMQVGQRRALRVTDVAAASDAGGLPADERDRQIVVEMRVAVTDAGPVEEQRVVQH